MQQISYNSVEDITDDIRKQIGWRIQEKRIEKGITAVDLSTYLNITANQVSRIERGCAGIDIYKLIVICKILGVSADYILFGEMKEENITIKKRRSVIKRLREKQIAIAVKSGKPIPKYLDQEIERRRR